MVPQYRVITRDLATARTAERLIDPGLGYDSVSVVAIPAGSAAEIAFGPSSDFIPITDPGQVWKFSDDCANPAKATEGLYLKNAASAGLLKVLVSFGMGT